MSRHHKVRAIEPITQTEYILKSLLEPCLSDRLLAEVARTFTPTNRE